MGQNNPEITPPSNSNHFRDTTLFMFNAGSDLGLLAETAGAAKGYYKGEDIQAREDLGIEAYVARPQRGSVICFGRRSSATIRPATPIAAPANSAIILTRG